jgi:tetratricopeptide (TPR) repeat protein
VCSAAGDAGDGLWSAHRAAVEQAFGATDAPFAASAFAFADTRLREFESAWRQAATNACEDTRVRHTQSIAMLDQRMACLTSRRKRVAAVVDALGRADHALVSDIDIVLAELPRLEECTDANVLTGKSARPTDAGLARRLLELEARIDILRGREMSRAGGAFTRDEVAAMSADADLVVQEATDVGYAPALADALILRSEIAVHRGEPDAARRDLVGAAAAATRGGDRERLATAYLDLLYLDADGRADLAGAESWSRLAGAAVDAIGGPPGKRADLAEHRALLAQRRGDPATARDLLEEVIGDATLPAELREPLKSDLALVLTDAGDYDAAERLFDELIPARTAALGAEHPKVLGLRANRANLFYFRGDFGRCREAHAELLPLREQVLGPGHAQVARTLNSLAVCLNKAGRAAEALPLLQRAVAIFAAQRGPDHPDTLSAKSDLGGVHNHLGDHASALAVNLEVLAARERELGEDHPDVAVTLVNTAIEAKNAGRVTDALAYHERALAIFERTLGPTHATLAFALINYGEALRAADRPVDAIAAFERSMKILIDALGPDHVVLAHDWYGIGLAELARGRARVAVKWLEQAVARRDRAGAELDRNEQAEARAALARALVAAGGDRARARTLAEQAIAAWTDLGDNFDKRRVELERWLATVE